MLMDVPSLRKELTWVALYWAFGEAIIATAQIST
jgi:hypothetical protein